MTVTLIRRYQYVDKDFYSLIEALLKKQLSLSDVRAALLAFAHPDLHARVIEKHRQVTTIPADVFLLKAKVRKLIDELVPDNHDDDPEDDDNES